MDLTHQVKDATNAIQLMPGFVDAIIGLLATPVGWILLAAFFFWLVMNRDPSHIFDLFERRQRRRVEGLDLYLSKPELTDPKALQVLRELRDAHYFKIATGINAEKDLRHALIRLHDCTSQRVTWRLIRRAFPYIDGNDDGSVSIREQSFVEKCEHRFNQFVSNLIFLFAAGTLSFLLLPFLYREAPPPSVLTTFATFVGLALLAIFLNAQNWPVLAARKIKSELEDMKAVELTTALPNGHGNHS